MTIHPLAGKRAPRSILANIPRLVSAYYTHKVGSRRPIAAGELRDLRTSRIIPQKQLQ